MNPSKTTKNDALLLDAAKRVGMTAELDRGILRGQVKILAYRIVYGRVEHLVATEAGDKEWVKASSLLFPKP